MALSILWSITATAPFSLEQQQAARAAGSSSSTAAAAGSSSTQYTAHKVVDSLLQLDLPSGLMKLLHYRPDIRPLSWDVFEKVYKAVDALQARAILLLQLLVCRRKVEMLTAIRCYAEYSCGEGQEQPWVVGPGVYLLQRCMTCGKGTVKAGAEKLLQDMFVVGTIGLENVKAL